MQLTPTIDEALAQVAWRYGVDVNLLRGAFERESPNDLAAALKLDPDVARDRMARVQRAVTVQSDVGAGCKLLTDDVQAEVLTAIAEL